jgi:hypothetical protein
MTEQHSIDEKRRPRAAAISHALTAGAALAAGVALGTVIARAPAAVTTVSLASTGIIPPSSPLHDALEQVPSAAEREIEAGVIVRPILTYGAMSGVWCRRFALRAESGRTDAVACRGEDVWRIAALITGPRVEEQDAFGRPPDANLIDAAVAATIDGEPLEPQDEIEVILGSWQQTDDAP